MPYAHFYFRDMICTVLRSAAGFLKSSTSGYHVSRKKVRPIAPASYGDLSYIYYVRPDLKHPPGSSWAHIVRPGTWPKFGHRLGLTSRNGSHCCWRSRTRNDMKTRFQFVYADICHRTNDGIDLGRCLHDASVHAARIPRQRLYRSP